jgi:hypothetical protein
MLGLATLIFVGGVVAMAPELAQGNGSSLSCELDLQGSILLLQELEDSLQLGELLGEDSSVNGRRGRSQRMSWS